MFLGSELTGLVELFLSLLIVVVAGVVLGTVSFGFGLTASPPFLLFLEPKSTVVIVNSLTTMLLVLVFASTWKQVDLRQCKGMVIGGMVGTPVGALLLGQAEPSLLRVIIGAVIVVMGLLSIREIRFPYATFPGSGLFFGFITCLLVTALSIGGLIGAVYTLAQKWPAQTMRASLAAMFVVSGAMQVTLYAVTGLVLAERAHHRRADGSGGAGGFLAGGAAGRPAQRAGVPPGGHRAGGDGRDDTAGQGTGALG